MIMSIEMDIISLINYKELELAAKGYSIEQTSVAIKRERKWAESISRKVDHASHDTVYLALFRAGLNEAEDWLDKIKNSGTRWQEGLEAAGLPVGPESRQAYESWVS